MIICYEDLGCILTQWESEAVHFVWQWYLSGDLQYVLLSNDFDFVSLVVTTASVNSSSSDVSCAKSTNTNTKLLKPSAPSMNFMTELDLVVSKSHLGFSTFSDRREVLRRCWLPRYIGPRPRPWVISACTNELLALRFVDERYRHR